MQLTVEEFEKLKELYKDTKTIRVRDENNVVVREIDFIFLDNHYDYDKSEFSENYPPITCRWNKKDTIFHWSNIKYNGISFTISSNNIYIYSSHINAKYNIVIKDKQIYIEGRNNVDNFQKEVEDNIYKFIKHINKMDIPENLKCLVVGLINGSEYVYSKDYKGYKKGVFNYE